MSDEVADARLERQISDAQIEWESAVNSGDIENARRLCRLVADLVNQRSDEQVTRMEKRMGLQ